MAIGVSAKIPAPTVWPTAIPEFAAYGPDKINLAERIQALRKNFQWARDGFQGNAG